MTTGGVKRVLLWTSWLVCFAAALAATSIFAHGVIRDMRAGEPVIAVDLSNRSGWQEETFRIFGEGRYRLFISSVNHDPARVGTPLNGALEVAVIDPDGNAVLEERFTGAGMGHAIPDNYGDTGLAKISLDDWPLRRWRLKVRVVEPDPAFEDVYTQVKLWKQRHDPGMGGLLNYVMIIPAGLFLFLALATSMALASRRTRWPLVLTLVVGVALVAGLTAV